ncbi:MAG: nucleotide exchange factor GrpE [Patescibacteria group bacterium]
MEEEKKEEKDNKEEVKTENNTAENITEKNIDYKDMAARALADLDNFKKRNEEEKQEFRRMATFNVISEFLDIYNNLKQAESFIPNEQKDLGWVKGVTMITLQFKERFKLFGIEEFNTSGKMFDHNTMEAVSTEKDETKEENIVLREISSGFKLGDKVVQHAKVIVNKLN